MSQRLLIVLSCCLLAAGCALPWNEPEGESPRELETRPEGGVSPSPRARELVARAVSPAASLQALEIQGKLKVVASGENKFSLRCEIELLLERPAKLRLAATKGLNTEIMDLAMSNDSLDVWLPRKNTLYRGRVRDLAANGMDFHPQEIVGQILFPVNEFASLEWGIAADSAEAIVVTEISTNRYKNRLTIARENGVLIRREIISPEGRVYLDARFSKYREIRGHEEIGLFPHQVQLSFPQEKRKLLFYRLKIMPNPATTRQDYRIVAPSTALVKPLKDDKEAAITAALQDGRGRTEGRGQ